MKNQYPIGKFTYSPDHSEEEREQWIDDIAMLPGRIRDEIEGCSDDVLLIPYREDGWTLREVIEHLMDSHMNTLIRIKAALAEENPTIRPYAQAAWVEAGNKVGLPLEFTLEFLENIHENMVRIFESLDEKQWQRTFFHPEADKTYTLDEVAALYAWHSNHHLAHIRLVTNEESAEN